MDTLPPLCVQTIAEQLIVLNKKHHDFSTIQSNARVAARLAMVGNDAFSSMAAFLYNTVVDPGCLDKAQEVYNKDDSERKDAEAKINVLVVVEPAKLADYKAVCASAGLPVSGTKAKLAERIMIARQEAEARLIRPVAVLPRSCPVRTRVVELVSFANKSMPIINTSQCIIAPFQVSRSHLDVLPCTLKRNPRYGRAAPLRLYDTINVAMLSLEKHGPGAIPMKCVAESIQAALDAKEALHAKKLALLCSKRKQELEACNKSSFSISMLSGMSQTMSEYLVGKKSTTCQEATNAMNRAISKLRRQRKLLDALNAANCELRADSRLCNLYIDSAVGEIAEIVATMVEMKFYFEHTKYESIRDDMFREMNANYRDRYDRYDSSDYDSDYDSDSDYNYNYSNDISEGAKYNALTKYAEDKFGASSIPDEDIDNDIIVPATLKKAIKQRLIRIKFAEFFQVQETKYKCLEKCLLQKMTNYNRIDEFNPSFCKPYFDRYDVLLTRLEEKKQEFNISSSIKLDANCVVSNRSDDEVINKALKHHVKNLLDTKDYIKCPFCVGSNRLFKALGLRDHIAAKHK